jgi:hypothetical protein
VDRDLAVLHAPAADHLHVLHEQLGVDLLGVVEKAEVVQGHAQLIGVVVEDGSSALISSRPVPNTAATRPTRGLCYSAATGATDPADLRPWLLS